VHTFEVFFKLLFFEITRPHFGLSATLERAQKSSAFEDNFHCQQTLHKGDKKTLDSSFNSVQRYWRLAKHNWILKAVNCGI